MCFTRLSEETDYFINRLIFVMESQPVSCEVRTENLNSRLYTESSKKNATILNYTNYVNYYLKTI
jgi:hypothetical protein